jgi:hypothetical protein
MHIPNRREPGGLTEKESGNGATVTRILHFAPVPGEGDQR